MKNANCPLCDRIEKLRSGSDSKKIAEFSTSILVLGDYQFYRGSLCLILKDHVTELTHLSSGIYAEFLGEMVACARAMETICKPLKINYELLGNVCPHIHWHLFPRYKDDTQHRDPIWLRPDAEKKLDLSAKESGELVALFQRELKHLSI